MRSVGQITPSRYVVSPQGLIKNCKYHANLGGIVRARMQRTQGGSERLSAPWIEQSAKEAGWEFLEVLYKAEGNPEGYDAYMEYARQLAAKAHGAYTLKPRRQDADGSGKGDSKEQRLFGAIFPEEMLPAEVVKRRNGNSAISGEVFKMPTPAKKAKASGSKSL